MIHFRNRLHGYKLMESIDAKFSPVTMEVISRTNEAGDLLGGVIYENWTGEGGSIEVHIASFTKHWLNRDMLFAIFDYPFRQLDCKQAFARVKAKNEPCLRFCKSVGWEQIFRLEGVFPDDDMILLRLKRDECRFLDVAPRRIRSNKGLIHG